MTTNMFEVQKAFKNDPKVLLLSHSVTPSIDTVARLKSYAEKFDIRANKWHLATGEKSGYFTILPDKPILSKVIWGWLFDDNDFSAYREFTAN